LAPHWLPEPLRNEKDEKGALTEAGWVYSLEPRFSASVLSNWYLYREWLRLFHAAFKYNR